MDTKVGTLTCKSHKFKSGRRESEQPEESEGCHTGARAATLVYFTMPLCSTMCL